VHAAQLAILIGPEGPDTASLCEEKTVCISCCYLHDFELCCCCWAGIQKRPVLLLLLLLLLLTQHCKQQQLPRSAALHSMLAA
jgi:hypothetical protein